MTVITGTASAEKGYSAPAKVQYPGDKNSPESLVVSLGRRRNYGSKRK